uniref:Uncharacterized protein n=1 Tax=Brassica oleracea var. oleracea TaxID=109376 RepID=A0A0D3CKB8_BRAOL
MMIRPGLGSVVVVGGTGSQSQDFSHFQDSPSPHSSYHTSPSAAPAPAPLAPAAAPAPAPPGPPGVMSVAELVRQPGRKHLPYLTPFNRSGNGISAWINRMMDSALDRGHPTFAHFPSDKQILWFRQFAQEFNWNSDETLFIYHHFVHKVMDNYGKQIHEWKKKWEINKRRKKLLPPTPPTAGATVKGRASTSITWVLNLLPLWEITMAEENDGEPVDDLALMRRAYTNKKTGQIDDGLVRENVTLVQTQVQDEVSQLQTEDDASTASTNLSRFRINEIVESSVPKKKRRLVGLGRRTRSVPPSSAPPPFVDPEVLTAQLKDKDDRISLLETQMAAQQAGYEAQRRLNQQMMEMMQRMYPNEVFPDVQTRTRSSEFFEGSVSRKFPMKIPRNLFLGIFRGLRSSEIPEENSEEHFVGTSEDWTIGKSIEIFRGAFRRTGGPRSFLRNLFPRNSVGKFRGIFEEK